MPTHIEPNGRKVKDHAHAILEERKRAVTAVAQLTSALITVPTELPSEAAKALQVLMDALDKMAIPANEIVQICTLSAVRGAYRKRKRP